MDRITSGLLRTYRNRIITPVIVQSKPGQYEAVRAQLKNVVPARFLQTLPGIPRLLGVTEVGIAKWKELKTFNMIATVLTSNLIEDIAQMGSVERIYPDYIKYAVQYPTVPEPGVFQDFRKKPFTTTAWVKKLIGLDRANQQGFTGSGIRAAVLDTGCRVDLPQVRHVKILSAMPEKGGTGIDGNGHGTWVNSCVGGKPAVDRRYNAPVEGMAPGADLHSIQVLGFIIGMGTTSDVLQGMDTALRIGAKVVSMSLGSEDSPPDAENPEAVAVDRLTQNGVIVVVAAGNSGPDPQTIGSPGSALNSLTVGAIDPITGAIADFSSRGPTKNDKYTKPDVANYGVRIDSQITGLIDDMVDPSQPNYAPISGTSMSTPVVAGLVTCMAQLYREKLGKELTTDEVKRMMSTVGQAKDNSVGWGLITWSKVEQWVGTP